MHFDHLKISTKTRLFAKYTDKYRQKYIPYDLFELKVLMIILVTVILFSLGRDAEKLVYGKTHLARFMESAIMTIDNEARGLR